MPQYRYTAIDTGGRTVRGVLDAANPSALYQRLKEQNIFCTDAVDLEDEKIAAKGPSKKVALKSLAIFARQFATLITSGVTIVKALDILYQQSEDRVLKGVIGQIYEGVQKGESLSDAFRKRRGAFPELLVNMVEAGEASGTLDNVMIRMADNFEKENKLRNKIRGAMIYPIVLMVLTIVVVIILLTFVLPTFIGLIESAGGELPGVTRFLLGISNVIKNYWYLIGGGTLALVMGWKAFTRSDAGRLWWDSLKFRIPVAGKSVTMIYASRFTRTLSTLLSSGIQMLQALEISGRVVGNRKIQLGLVSAVEDIRKGTTLSSSLKRITEFPIMVTSMIHIGEESGRLDSVLDKTAAFYDEEGDAAVAKLVSLLEPLMIIFMAVVVGFIIISIMLPMFSMYQAIGGG